jgi:hypothetical protein
VSASGHRLVALALQLPDGLVALRQLVLKRAPSPLALDLK